MKYHLFQVTMGVLGFLFPAPIFPAPPKAPPVDERFDRIEYRLNRIEAKLGLADCDCAETGKCDCKLGECDCENCPVHRISKSSKGTKGDGPALQYMGRGKEVVLFVTDDCAPCEAAKRRLGDLLDEIVIVHCPDGNLPENVRHLHVSQFPTAVLSLNGEHAKRCVGSNVGTLIVGDWLGKRVGESVLPESSPAVSYDDGDASDDQIRQHLVDAHGYSWGQVSGMSRSQLKAAHDRGHGGPARVSKSYPVRTTFQPTQYIRYSNSYCPSCAR